MNRTILIATVSCLPLFACAQTPYGGPAPYRDAPYTGAHPAYKHATANLRLAKEKIERRRPEDGAVAQDEQFMLQEIDYALGDLHRADIDDAKFQNIPPPDPNLPQGRLHTAEVLLRTARSDISGREDNPRAQPEQAHAIEHIDRALQAAHHIIYELHRD